MTFVKRNRARVFSVLALLLCALTMFSACQEPQQSIPGSVDSISVRVMDGMDSKTITPEGNVNISHYVITVVNEAEGINQSSGYLTKGSMFTVSNVPAGTWYAKVDAYIDRGEDTYVKVASDQSEPKTVQAGENTTFDLMLDALDAAVSGDVTVTLKMPAGLSAQSTAFWYQYTITGMTDEEFTHTSAPLSGTTGADGLATITLDADAIGLMQGAYRFEITVQDAETSPTLTRKGVDVMRLVNGLEAKGTIDLSGYEADQSFEITVTDKIGDILTPSIKDGKEVYNLDGQDGSASLTVTLDEPLSDTETIEWYVDGELDETVNAEEAASGKYTLTFTPGSHIVTAIVRDADTLMAVGSIDEFKVSLVVAEITAQMFTFSPIGEAYTVTGLANSIGEFEMPKSGVLEIPATYKGKPVLIIGERAFEGRTDIVGSVVIPDSVTIIRASAFRGCSALQSINIPDCMTSIGFYAFKGCSSLTSINIPNRVTSIGEEAFSGCSSLASITIPDGVTSIGASAFENCSSLTSISIPEGITTIKIATFKGCSALAEVNLPSTLTAIEGDSFHGGAFENSSSLTEINIPDGVTSIGDSAFNNCSSLTSITIPDRVTSIGYQTFRNCSSLTEIVIPEGVTSIEGSAFEGCSSLTEIVIPEDVTSIGIWTFLGCSGLTDIVIPESVTSMGHTVFSRCSNLASIYCEATVQPEGWDESWKNNCNADVFWGASRSEYDAIMNNDSVPYDVAEPVVGYDSETVTLSCDTSFAHIYYTLDGSEPDKDSTLYTEPFRHIGDFTLKAVAYVGNGIYSDVVTKPLSSVGSGGID